MDPKIQKAEENWGDVDPEYMSDHSDQEDTCPVLGQRFRVDSRFHIMDRWFDHPVRAFNDTSGFQEVGAYFLEGQQSLRMNYRRKNVMTQKSQ